MNIIDFEYIYIVAHEKSLTKAAEKLFISQPSLSRIISDIEKNYNVTLFDRKKSPIQITDAGKIFVNYAEEILKINDQLNHAMSDLNNLTKGSLKIGCMLFEQKYFLPKVLYKFHLLFPNIDLNIISGTSADLQNMLERDLIDFAFLIDPLDTNNIYSQYLTSYDIILAVSKNHKLAQNVIYPQLSSNLPIIDVHCLKDEDLIILKQGRKMRDILITTCLDNGFNPKIVLETDTFDASHSFSYYNFGISFVLSPILDYTSENARCAYFKIKNKSGNFLKQSLYSAISLNKKPDKLIKAFANCIKMKLPTI